MGTVIRRNAFAYTTRYRLIKVASGGSPPRGTTSTGRIRTIITLTGTGARESMLAPGAFYAGALDKRF
eukprot:7328507-Heterocapsa_arctica.AAC.1